jgi:hypothetical protein
MDQGDKNVNKDQASQFSLDERLLEKLKTVNFEKNISNQKYIISYHQTQIQTWCLTTHPSPLIDTKSGSIQLIDLIAH